MSIIFHSCWSYFWTHSYLCDMTRRNSFSPNWRFNDRVSYCSNQGQLNDNWMPSYIFCLFVIEWLQGSGFLQSAARTLHFIGKSRSHKADHYQCLGRLLTSPALPACHAPGSATCYISDKISDVFLPPLLPPHFSFAEVMEIYLRTSVSLVLSLSSRRRRSERKQNSEEKVKARNTVDKKKKKRR